MNPLKPLKSAFKRYFVIGLITIIPFAVTIKVFAFVLDYFNSVIEIRDGKFLYFLSEVLHPDRLLGFRIPLLGLIFTILVILGVGVLSRNYLGRTLLSWSDRSISHIPMVRVVYGLVKQALDTFTKGKTSQFSRVVLIEYPRKRIYTLAFVTGKAPPYIVKEIAEPALSVFVPTTPNPTSGFYLVVPEKDAVELTISVEEAFKLIVTAGMVSDTHA